MNKQFWDVIVIGSGPSGLMAAITAAQRKAKVLLIEKNKKLGLKIVASGNGRCNITNLKKPIDFIDQLYSNNKKFLLSSLSDFSSNDIYNFLEANGTQLKVESDDRVFPLSDKSMDVLGTLVFLINKYRVMTKMGETVTRIFKNEEMFLVETNIAKYKSKNVIIATGGKSYPALGTTGDGYKFLKDFGLNINPTFPSLVPLVSNTSFIQSKNLQGLTLQNVEIRYKNTKEFGNVLFTHFGISGPIVLKLSELVSKDLSTNKTVEIILDTIPNFSKEEIIIHAYKNMNTSLFKLFKNYLPTRLINEIIAEEVNTSINKISRGKLEVIIDTFKNLKIVISDTKGYKDAFITQGGLDVKQVDPKTMMIKSIPGLYVTGELLDVHGPTGGYNMTIAFSTGHKAGLSVRD